MAESSPADAGKTIAGDSSQVPMRAGRRPTAAQERYLRRGLDQPGGKLPLFDATGQRIDRKTVESCIQNGWCEPWFANPTKPDWLVCKLTAIGYRVLGREAAEPTTDAPFPEAS